MIISRPIRYAFLLSWVLMVFACKSGQPDSGTETVAATVKYDWTGTYSFADEGAETAYTLRLHKRSVDGSYEMQYSRSVEAKTNTYPEYMFDAKDGDSSITIRFMGSFTAPEAEWPFQKGDTMCILTLQADAGIVTDWKALQPKGGTGGFRQMSKAYN